MFRLNFLWTVYHNPIKVPTNEYQVHRSPCSSLADSCSLFWRSLRSGRLCRLSSHALIGHHNHAADDQLLESVHWYVVFLAPDLTYAALLRFFKYFEFQERLNIINKTFANAFAGDIRVQTATPPNPCRLVPLLHHVCASLMLTPDSLGLP